MVSTTSKVKRLIPICCTNFSPSSRIHGNLDDITSGLQEIVEEICNLCLTMVTNEKRKIIRYEACLVDASGIVGREGDKKVLLRKLLGDEDDSCNQNFSIVFIVGVGGIGKITLLLYGEEEVKDHFKLRALVCVSDEFKIFNISKVIEDLNLHEEMLKEKLLKKCFLIVLDDVWTESYLPLALKTLGRLLRTKIDEEEWKEREMRLFQLLD